MGNINTDIKTGHNDTSWATTMGNKYVVGRQAGPHPSMHSNIPAVCCFVANSLEFKKKWGKRNNFALPQYKVTP